MAFHEVSDHALLLGGVAASIAENRASADKWARMVEFFRRREADDGARHARDRFALTARQHTVVEVGELWRVPESWVRRQLNVALCVTEHFAYVWALCRDGQLDAYRATLIADAARHALTDADDFAALAERIDPYLARHLKTVPGAELPLVACTPKQLRNKLSFELRKIRSRDAEERFAQAHENRAVSGRWGEDGISWLTIGSTSDQVQLARHRLTLGHRAACAPTGPGLGAGPRLRAVRRARLGRAPRAPAVPRRGRRTGLRR